MKNIKFVSHEFFPEDDYTKEILYLCIDDKYRVAYVRKKTSSGSLYWSGCTISAMKNGKKEYFPTFIQDSNFLERDIRDFLENRSWDSSESTKSDEGLPF